MLKLESRNTAALPVLRREGGLLLAVDAEAITAEEIEARKIGGVTDDLGLVGRVEVRATLADAQQVEISLLLFDWPTTLNKYLRWGVAETWPRYCSQAGSYLLSLPMPRL